MIADEFGHLVGALLDVEKHGLRAGVLVGQLLGLFLQGRRHRYSDALVPRQVVDDGAGHVAGSQHENLPLNALEDTLGKLANN